MYQLKYSLKLPISIEVSWKFFSSPANLKILTPEHLSFEILDEEDIEKMYPGKIIRYIIRPIGNIPIEWVTEIRHIQEPFYFIDEQRIGPYKFWHHEHRFKSIQSGTEMIDTVHYQMPFGVLGRAFHYFKVKKDLENIFFYRQTKLEQIFGVYNGIQEKG
jgi:ligand-binding SRPBCC domain-containing protein